MAQYPCLEFHLYLELESHSQNREVGNNFESHQQMSTIVSKGI